MGADITHYASLRNSEITYCGMASTFALRNIAAMEVNGLKAARKRIGMTQPDIAERLGVSVPQVSRWENGENNIPSYRLPALAAAYEATIGELFDGDADDLSGTVILDGALPVQPIPLLGDVPAGNWREAVKKTHHFIPAPEAGIPKSAYALKVVGDSMNKVVRDGATIIIDPTDLDLFDRSYFVVRNGDGETTFKQYLDGPARLVPCSTNPDHKVTLLGSEELAILGRVILITMRPDQAALD